MDMIAKLISVFIVFWTCMNPCDAVAESGSDVGALVTNHTRKQLFGSPPELPFVPKPSDMGERTLPPDMQYIVVNRSDEELIIEDCLVSYSLCMTFERARNNTQICSVQIEMKKTFRSFCEMIYENCKTSNSTWSYFHDGPCLVEFVEENKPFNPLDEDNPPQPPPPRPPGGHGKYNSPIVPPGGDNAPSPGGAGENNPPFFPPGVDNAPAQGGAEGSPHPPPPLPPSPSPHKRYSPGTFWF